MDPKLCSICWRLSTLARLFSWKCCNSWISTCSNSGKTQQDLVATVEGACRQALGYNFLRLVLVGSAALRVETPGSDVDVVCFTRPSANGEAIGLPVDVLRKVSLTLSDNYCAIAMVLIADSHVPILRVSCCNNTEVVVDVSVDQNRPVDHVRWFQRVGAAPRPTQPPPVVAPLVTLTLRCVKWWLRTRQIPRRKEGGLPALAWLLMAVHVCSLPETHEQAIQGGQRIMVALLASLTAFFSYYAKRSGLNGVLVFAADGSSAEFKRHTEEKSSQWAELSVLDPTRSGSESLDLAPRLSPATQLLLTLELCRASQRLNLVQRCSEIYPGESRRILDEVFEPLPEGYGALPSRITNNITALFLWSEDSSNGCNDVELCCVMRVMKRPGWTAPFLHRADDRSEVHVLLYDVEEHSGTYHVNTQRENRQVTRLPCQFICRVDLEKDGRTTRLRKDGVERFRMLKQCLSEMQSRQCCSQKMSSTKETI